jgi:methyltransferase (TIGR00027 family)
VDHAAGPESSAERVALWRALHVQVDGAPPVLDDRVGLRLAYPVDGWRSRPDMDPDGTRWFRASIVGRARFVEDLMAGQAEAGVDQFVVLGAGLDTFAQRRADLAADNGLRVFEVDQAGPQAWKRRRLVELGLGVPEWLRLVPVDFEGGGSWLEELAAAGFDAGRPAVVVSTGVTFYLTKEANAATLRQIAGFAGGTTLALTFVVPPELVAEELQAGFAAARRGAHAAGTPFVSFYTPDELVELARESGFRTARHVSCDELNERYFAGRDDGLRMVRGEELLVATT